MAQSGVLRVPRVQLIRGLARTKETANLSAATASRVCHTFRPRRGGIPVKNLIAVGMPITERPPQSGRIEARTGLRMMPTFPRSPRSFRTAGFPQYGWKAGLAGG